ncbi:MAG TPA: biotin--[acetyl-CoA-carboxylase] ligase [Anaerolineae bacterium]|nr:biotin--[acetyl-CoA-carboxylase] ligase [Anaerolineae bacterium]HRX01646.1 biotin--[acetyl-CoA-carboxylase] ligase [Anaerolineae bacterium]
MSSQINPLLHMKPPATLIGSTLTVLPVVDSTQNVAREAALRGQPEGLAVVAGQQTAGKGRLGREWWSPAEGGLYVSLLLRPRITPDRLGWLTMVVSLGTAEAIEAVCGVSPDLKWPNDLTWRGRKLAGVLAEASFADGQVSYVIAGIGLNLQMDFALRPDLAQRAVSLREITGRPVRIEPLLQALLERIDAHYLSLQGGVSPQPRWAARLRNLGQTVSVTTSEGKTLVGVAEGVEEDGRLVLRLADNSMLVLSAGDVTLGSSLLPEVAA